MPPMHRVLSSLLLAPLLLGWPHPRDASAEAVARVNCRAPHQRDMDLAPVGVGPLTLATVYCQTGSVQSVPFRQKSAGFARRPLPRLLRLRCRGTRGPARRRRGLDRLSNSLGTFETFSANIRSALALAWAANSRFLWTATHDALRPSGFATGPLRPMQAAEDGSLRPLPERQHDAGTLDALLWAGGDGLAAAQFGTRGGFYRPEHDDRAPTFALVDARRGLVLDSLPFDAIESLRGRRPGAAAHAEVSNAAAAVLPDGRVRVLLDVGSWVVWTQGEAPRVLPNPYPGEWHSRMVLSPDGSRVLVSLCCLAPAEACASSRADVSQEPRWRACSRRCTISAQPRPTTTSSPCQRSARIGAMHSSH